MRGYILLMSDYIDILGSLAELARKKAISIIKKHGRGVAKKVSDGAYGHRSSLIDVEVEKAIIKSVEDNDLPFNIFTEEAGHMDRGYPWTLIMDPVDGSNNAETGIPFYSVSLALTRGTLKDVEYAFVKNIPLNVDYWAVRGGGAFRDGIRLHTEPGTNVFFLYLGRKAWARSYELARIARRVRDMGSASLEMIAVAEGIADLFHYGFKDGGALRIVDIAASYLIVKEAGGIVLDGNLNPLDMQLDFNERKNVFALADQSIMEVLK